MTSGCHMLEIRRFRPYLAIWGRFGGSFGPQIWLGARAGGLRRQMGAQYGEKALIRTKRPKQPPYGSILARIHGPKSPKGPFHRSSMGNGRFYRSSMGKSSKKGHFIVRAWRFGQKHGGNRQKGLSSIEHGESMENRLNLPQIGTFDRSAKAA